MNGTCHVNWAGCTLKNKVKGSQGVFPKKQIIRSHIVSSQNSIISHILFLLMPFSDVVTIALQRARTQFARSIIRTRYTHVGE